MDAAGWPVVTSVVVFVACAAAIGLAGPRLVRVLDELADRTGLGEAFFGVALLGGITSISGVVTSVTAAADGLPALSFSNAVGGIAVQTLFLVVADATYRGANLEHAAPSLSNLVSATLLIVLLGLVLAGALGPDVTVAGVAVVSPLIVAGYLVGLRLVQLARQRPWWEASDSVDTEKDEDQKAVDSGRPMARLAAEVAVFGAMLGFAGWALANAGASLAAQTGISQTVVGALLTATVTSLSELVTTVAAVRAGALTLAIAGIVGGNAFDVLFLPAADVAYRPGSIYRAVGDADLLVLVATILMTAVLLLGLLMRQPRGLGRVGWEGIAIAAIYVATIAYVALD